MSEQTNEQVPDKNNILWGTRGDVFFLQIY